MPLQIHLSGAHTYRAYRVDGVETASPLSRPADRQQDAVPAAFHVEERRGTVAGTSRFAVGMVAVACPEPVRDQTVVGVRDVRSLRYPKAKHIRLPGALPVATGARRVGVKRNRNVAVIEIGDATAVMVGRIVPAVYPAHDSVVIPSCRTVQFSSGNGMPS